ncbi:MAG: hypothetical protein HOP15_13160 [Planctomycetes bacterium]|nr:hypothetical protein [Planctomycetota bacterium]
MALASQHGAQDRLLEIYRDPAEFEKVSGAFQNLLIAKYGPRPILDKKGNVVTPTSGGHAGAAIPSTGGVISALGNVLVNNAGADATAQDTQSETALVLGSGSNLISAFNDSGSFIGANHFTGWAYSSNNGVSWTDPGLLPGSNDAGDPVLARDNTTGRTYLACLFFSGSGINLFRSDDDGATWMPAVNAAPSSGAMDKEWIAVDNFAGPGNGNVYHVVRDFGAANGVYFFRSTDQGATWGPFGGTLIASGSPSNVQGAYVAVGPNHDVYSFWYDSNPTPDQIRMRTSSDQGLTFGPVVTVTTLTSTGTNGSLSLVAGFRSSSFPAVAVNPVSGAIYVVYNDPVAASGGDRGNVFLRQSTDGGATWSAAMLVNDDGTARAQYFPTVACRPDGTGLGVCWYDNRSHAGDVNIERWGVTASIAGSTITFGPNFRISPQFVPVFGVDPVVNSVYMGDYDMMAADDAAYYTTWGDNRDNSIAVPTRKNANVRFTSFGPSGPGAFLDFESAAVSGGNGNGRIEFNECNELVVTLRNNGAEAASSIASILSTLTAGVTIVAPAQPYADLSGGEADSATFTVSTSPAFACGTTIHFTLALTYSNGPQVLEFDLTTGGAGYVITAGTDAIVAGSTDIGNHGDDVVTTIALPFPVTFYTSTYTQVALSSNGNAQFTGASNAYANECLPSGSLSNVIVLQWDDLRTDGVGEGIFRSETGVAPNREFHIEWRTHYYSGAGTANFELRLHEGSSSFDMIFGTVGQNGTSATIGCQLGTGPDATQHACNATGSVSAGTKLTYALPGCPDGGGECGSGLPPSVSAVAPDHGPNTGLTGVVITGSSFTGASSVSFGSNAASFTVDSDTQITAALGATSTTGFVDVSVTNSSGTGSLTGAFDYFAPPIQVGTACSTPTLTWSGAPVIGRDYTVTTLNLGGASQILLVDWALHGERPRARRFLPVACPQLVLPDLVIALGTSPSHTFSIPSDNALIGVHLRTQALILAPAASTQALDATIGE